MRHKTIIASAVICFLIAPLHAQDSTSYSRHVRPFLARYCLECHNAKELKGGLNLATYDDLKKGSDNGPVIEPGTPDKSVLVLLTEGKDSPRMPPRKARQPKASEIGVLRAWVAAGAKDDSGSVQVAIPDIKPNRPIAAPITALAYRPDGGLLAAAKYKKVALINPATGSEVGQLTTSASVTAMAFAPVGSSLAVASGRAGQDAEILVFDDPLANKPPRVLARAHADGILDMAFSPDGKMLATCSYDTTVRVWNASTLEQSLLLKEHSDSVYGLAFSPDGQLLATAAADRAVKVWRLANGKLLYTLGEATDWVYAVAWSRTGRLAAAGVDKSIRVWQVNADKGKLLNSVFAHEAPVLRLLYSADGQTLYSLGEERIVKAWDAARMVESRIFDRQPDSALSLALRPDGKQLALGRYDGELVFLDTEPEAEESDCGDQEDKTPKKEDTVMEVESNDSPSTGQLLELSATIAGSCARFGDVDFYRFEAKAGQEVGVHVAKPDKSKLEPYLELMDGTGRVLVSSERSFLGHVCVAAGTYALGVRDREFKGGKDMTYKLRIGEVPVVTSHFPLGLQRGTQAAIDLAGVHLDSTSVVVKADGKAAPGSKIPLKLITPLGEPHGLPSVVVGTHPEIREAGPGAELLEVPVPGIANGFLHSAGAGDIWRFFARKGERLIIEVDARRLGADLDSVIEILDSQNQPIPRAVLRSLAKTYVTFRDHNSAQGNVRIEAWGELAVKDYIYVGNQLLRIDALPTHPDADCNFFTDRGQRTGYLDTTPTHLAKGEPMYKVTLHPPGTVFPPNGFPVITLYYRNDDGGPGYGRDSRLFFDPPGDGEYRVRISDVQGRGGSTYAYRLTVRSAAPRFTLSLSPTNPSVPRGGALPITVTAVRVDGYDGAIRLEPKNLPAGFSAPATAILPGENATSFALFADANAKAPQDKSKLTLFGRADIAGKDVIATADGGMPKLIDPGDIVTTTEESAVTIRPGGQTRVTVNIERRKDFKGRVPLSVRGLPHGVRVLDIGLNGILITERETRRTIVIYAEPWVQPMEHPFVISSRREGTNVEHGAKSVLLKVIE